MSIWNFFMSVAMVSAVSVGGQHVLMLGLEHEFVGRGLLTAQEYAKAIAFGLSTPGPWTAHIASIGLELHGFAGAVAAVMALIVVSIICVILMTKVPSSFFSRPKIRAGLATVPAIVAAAAIFLAHRVFTASEGQTLTSLLIVAGVGFGMNKRVPSPLLIVCAMLAAWLGSETSKTVFSDGGRAYYETCSKAQEIPLSEQILKLGSPKGWNLCASTSPQKTNP